MTPPDRLRESARGAALPESYDYSELEHHVKNSKFISDVCLIT